MTEDPRLAATKVPVNTEAKASFIRVTRSKGPVKHQLLPFPIVSLSLIVEAYHKSLEASATNNKKDLQALLYGADEDDDENGDDDESDDDESDDEDYEDKQLLNLQNLVYDDDDEDIEDPYAKEEPCYNVDVSKVIPSAVKQICTKYPQLVEMVKKHLDKKEIATFDKLLK